MNTGCGYFSFGSEHNFEHHKTAQEAIDAADAAIDDYRGDACDGWSEEVNSVCWGIIMQTSTQVGVRPRNGEDSCDPSIETICDYALLPDVDPTQLLAADERQDHDLPQKREPAGYHAINESGAVVCSLDTLEEAEETCNIWNKSWTIKPYYYEPQPLANSERQKLEQMIDNAHEALSAVLESGDVMNEHVIAMLKRGLNNQPQEQAK